MLLAIGAMAARTAQPDAVRGDDATAPPWRRWVSEDVDLAGALAADALAGGATLPPTLGPDLLQAVTAVTVDSLGARYESMITLLSDVEQLRPGSHPRVAEALDRCAHRLRELQHHRLATTPPRGIDLPAAAAAVEHHYLPGELLG